MKRLNLQIKSVRARITIIAVIAAFGLLLISLSFVKVNDNTSMMDSENYANYLERRIENIIGSATNTEETKVLITLKKKVKLNTSESTEIFSYNHSKIPDNYDNYEIAGVMILCKGLTSAEDFRTLKCAVATALDIHQNKIYIIGGE